MSIGLYSALSGEAEKLKDKNIEITVTDEDKVNIENINDPVDMVKFNCIYNKVEIDAKQLGENFDLDGFGFLQINPDKKVKVFQEDSEIAEQKCTTYRDLLDLLGTSFTNLRTYLLQNNVDIGIVIIVGALKTTSTPFCSAETETATTLAQFKAAMTANSYNIIEWINQIYEDMGGIKEFSKDEFLNTVLLDESQKLTIIKRDTQYITDKVTIPTYKDLYNELDKLIIILSEILIVDENTMLTIVDETKKEKPKPPIEELSVDEEKEKEYIYTYSTKELYVDTFDDLIKKLSENNTNILNCINRLNTGGGGGNIDITATMKVVNENKETKDVTVTGMKEMVTQLNNNTNNIVSWLNDATTTPTEIMENMVALVVIKVNGRYEMHQLKYAPPDGNYPLVNQPVAYIKDTFEIAKVEDIKELAEKEVTVNIALWVKEYYYSNLSKPFMENIINSTLILMKELNNTEIVSNVTLYGIKSGELVEQKFKVDNPDDELLEDIPIKIDKRIIGYIRWPEIILPGRLPVDYYVRYMDPITIDKVGDFILSIIKPIWDFLESIVDYAIADPVDLYVDSMGYIVIRKLNKYEIREARIVHRNETYVLDNNGVCAIGSEEQYETVDTYTFTQNEEIEVGNIREVVEIVNYSVDGLTWFLNETFNLYRELGYYIAHSVLAFAYIPKIVVPVLNGDYHIIYHCWQYVCKIKDDTFPPIEYPIGGTENRLIPIPEEWDEEIPVVDQDVFIAKEYEVVNIDDETALEDYYSKAKNGIINCLKYVFAKIYENAIKKIPGLLTNLYDLTKYLFIEAGQLIMFLANEAGTLVKYIIKLPAFITKYVFSALGIVIKPFTYVFTKAYEKTIELKEWTGKKLSEYVTWALAHHEEANRAAFIIFASVGVIITAFGLIGIWKTGGNELIIDNGNRAVIRADEVEEELYEPGTIMRNFSTINQNFNTFASVINDHITNHPTAVAPGEIEPTESVLAYFCKREDVTKSQKTLLGHTYNILQINVSQTVIDEWKSKEGEIIYIRFRRAVFYDQKGYLRTEFNIHVNDGVIYNPIITYNSEGKFHASAHVNDTTEEILFIGLDVLSPYNLYDMFMNGEMEIYYDLKQTVKVLKCDIIDAKNALKLRETDSPYLYKPSVITQEGNFYKMVFNMPADYKLFDGFTFQFKEFCFHNQWTLIWQNNKWTGDNAIGTSNGNIIQKLKKIHHYEYYDSWSRKIRQFDGYGSYIMIKDNEWNRRFIPENENGLMYSLWHQPKTITLYKKDGTTTTLAEYFLEMEIDPTVYVWPDIENKNEGIYVQPPEGYSLLLIKLTIPKYKDNWGSEYPTDAAIAKYAELDRIVVEITLNGSNASNVLTFQVGELYNDTGLGKGYLTISIEKDTIERVMYIYRNNNMEEGNRNIEIYLRKDLVDPIEEINWDPSINPFTYIINLQYYQVLPRPEAASTLYTDYNIYSSKIITADNITTMRSDLNIVTNNVDVITYDIDQLRIDVSKLQIDMFEQQMKTRYIMAELDQIHFSNKVRLIFSIVGVVGGLVGTYLSNHGLDFGTRAIYNGNDVSDYSSLADISDDLSNVSQLSIESGGSLQRVVGSADRINGYWDQYRELLMDYDRFDSDSPMLDVITGQIGELTDRIYEEYPGAVMPDWVSSLLHPRNAPTTRSVTIEEPKDLLEILKEWCLAEYQRIDDPAKFKDNWINPDKAVLSLSATVDICNRMRDSMKLPIMILAKKIEEIQTKNTPDIKDIDTSGMLSEMEEIERRLKVLEQKTANIDGPEIPNTGELTVENLLKSYGDRLTVLEAKCANIE